MRPNLVVIVSPGRDLASSILQRFKPMLIQAAVAELAVEAFDEGILCRLAGLDKVQLRAGLLRPKEHRL